MVVVLSMIVAVGVWFLPGAAASQILPLPGQPTTTTTTQTTTTSQPTTSQPPATDPPATDPPVTEAPPPEEEEEPPPDPEPEEESDDTQAVAAGPLDTLNNVLVEGDGTSGAQVTTTTAAPEEDEGSSSDDRRRLVWMIIAGLGAVALLVALLTWRYWLLTRPGLDLADDEQDDDPIPQGSPGGDRMARRPEGRRDQRTAVPASSGWAPPVGPPPGPANPPPVAPPPLPPLDDGPARWPEPQEQPRPTRPGRQSPPVGGQVFIEAPGQGPGQDPQPSRQPHPHDEGSSRERDPFGWDDPPPNRG